jgi:hypothetical protein
METAQVFRPKAIPRQGERNAWILTGFALIATLMLFWRSSTLPVWAIFLTFFLLLSAILISLSNWVDRKTTLILNPNGIEFRNGLRNARLNWEQVERVSDIPDRLGRRVVVLGSVASFHFRMLGEIEIRGKVGGQMGFPEGETILREIIQASGLSLTKSDDPGRYYARP